MMQCDTIVLLLTVGWLRRIHKAYILPVVSSRWKVWVSFPCYMSVSRIWKYRMITVQDQLPYFTNLYKLADQYISIQALGRDLRQFVLCCFIIWLQCFGACWARHFVALASATSSDFQRRNRRRTTTNSTTEVLAASSEAADGVSPRDWEMGQSNSEHLEVETGDVNV